MAENLDGKLQKYITKISAIFVVWKQSGGFLQQTQVFKHFNYPKSSFVSVYCFHQTDLHQSGDRISVLDRCLCF